MNPEEITNYRGSPTKDSRRKAMMRDPRYWRDRDPAFIRQVKDGFACLYDNAPSKEATDDGR